MMIYSPSVCLSNSKDESQQVMAEIFRYFLKTNNNYGIISGKNNNKVQQICPNCIQFVQVLYLFKNGPITSLFLSYFYLSYNSLSVPTFLLISIPKTNSSRKENESRHICQDKLNYAMVTNDSKNIGGFKQGIISC